MQIICVYQSNFLQKLRNKKEQKKLNNLEVIAREINKNPKLKKMATFVLANMLYCQTTLAKTVNTAKIDKAGSTILDICRTIGYWVCIIMCITSIIKELLQGDTKSITKIMMKFSLAFAALYLYPWILDVIKEIFA